MLVATADSAREKLIHSLPNMMISMIIRPVSECRGASMPKFINDGTWEKLQPKYEGQKYDIYRRAGEVKVVVAKTGEDMTAKWAEQARAAKNGAARERLRRVLEKEE